MGETSSLSLAIEALKIPEFERRLLKLEAWTQYLRQALKNVVEEINQNDVEYMHLKRLAAENTKPKPLQATSSSTNDTNNIEIITSEEINGQLAPVEEVLSDNDYDEDDDDDEQMGTHLEAELKEWWDISKT